MIFQGGIGAESSSSRESRRVGPHSQQEHQHQGVEQEQEEVEQQQQQRDAGEAAVAGPEGGGGGLIHDPASSGSLRYPKFTQLPAGSARREKTGPGPNSAAAPIPAAGSKGGKPHGSCDQQSAGSSPRCVISKSTLESSTSTSPSSGSKSVSEMDEYSDVKQLIGRGGLNNRSSSPSDGDDDAFFGSSTVPKSAAASPGFRSLDGPRGGNSGNAPRQQNVRGNGELGQTVYKMGGGGGNHARSISSSAVPATDPAQKFGDRRGGQLPEPAEAIERVYGHGGKSANVSTAPCSPAMDAGALSDSGGGGQSRGRARSGGRNSLRGSQSHELLSLSAKESPGWSPGEGEGGRHSIHSIHSMAAAKNSPLDPILESLMKASIMKDGNQFKQQQSQIAEKIEELKRKNGMARISSSAQSHHHSSFSHGGPGAFSFNQTHVVRVSDADFLDYDSNYDTVSNSSFDFARGGGADAKAAAAAHRAVLSNFTRPTPSKWDDAEKWLSSEPPQPKPKSKSKSGPQVQVGALAVSRKAAFLNQAGRLIPNIAQLAKAPPSTAAAAAAAASCSEASSSSGCNDVVSNDGDEATTTTTTTTASSDAHPHRARRIDSTRFVAKTNSDDDDPDAAGGGSTRFLFLPAASPRPGFLARTRTGSLDRYPIDDLVLRESGDAAIDAAAFVEALPAAEDEDLDSALRTEKPTSDSPPKEDSSQKAAADGAKCEAQQQTAGGDAAAPKVCMRDMGTAMTPVPSVEPSRAPTPVCTRTPTMRSPSSSRPATPSRAEPASSPISDGEKKVHYTDKELQSKTRQEILALGTQLGKRNIAAWATKEEEEEDSFKSLKSNVDLEEVKKAVIATRAAAWEDSEQAKYMARFNRDEAKILAWENHERAKAEAEMRRIEMKIERMRSHANEKLMNKLAATRRSAGELRAAAAARRGEQASKTTQRAEYIRRTGKIPSSLFANFCCS